MNLWRPDYEHPFSQPYRGGDHVGQRRGDGAGRRGPDSIRCPAVAASAVGRWLYDAQGHILGSVRSLDANGRTAVIMVGTYFQDGSHLATIPASALSIVNNRVTLRTDTVEALNNVWQR